MGGGHVRTVYLRRLMEDYLLLVRASVSRTSLACDVFIANLKVCKICVVVDVQ